MVNEKRLIDANALTNKFLRHYTKQEKKGNLSFVACEIKQGFADMVNEAPTVDAVEVVRCKDCKHFVQGEPYDPCECMRWKVKWGAVYTTPDGYCHKGERKDNG